MKRYRFKLIQGLLFFILLFSSCLWISCESKMDNEDTSSQTTSVNKEVLTVDPQAVEILRRGLDYLSNLKQFSAQAQNTYEDILESGHRVDYEIAGGVTLKRPNKLRTERYGEKMHQIFYYNGKTLTLYNPDEKVYATSQAPATITEMFHFARDTFGISVPVSDLLYENSFELLNQDLNYAIVVGKEMIGEVMCNHLLFSRRDADFQIWIADSELPLPYKYVVTDKTTPELLSFSTTIYDWDTNPTISDNFFNFLPPKGTSKIIFLKANAENGDGN